MATVRVEPVEGYENAYWLIWDAEVSVEDVAPAFRQLTAALDAASSAVHVMVDLRSDPHLPLAATTQETLAGPFRHPRMGEWLVIGTNWRAEVVANVISKVGLRMNIRWYATEEDALNHLKELATRAETP